MERKAEEPAKADSFPMPEEFQKGVQSLLRERATIDARLNEKLNDARLLLKIPKPLDNYNTDTGAFTRAPKEVPGENAK